jgi:hypothetical protein
LAASDQASDDQLQSQDDVAMTRWMRPAELDRRQQQHQFDPIVEGARYQLSRELLIAIWQRACADATDNSGRRDLEQATRLFHDLATRFAARGGRRGPDVGKTTRVELEQLGDARYLRNTDPLKARTPGRETLVVAEGRRWATTNAPSAVFDADSKITSEGVGPPAAQEVALAMAALQRPGTSGAAIEPGVRVDFESAFGESFSDVRVYEGDGVADAAGAQAVARGNDIHFAKGRYAPGTPQGRFLLGHELTHVVQQRQGQMTEDRVRRLIDDAMGSGRSPREHEADRIGMLVAAGQPAGKVIGGVARGTMQNYGPNPADILPEPETLTLGGDPFSIKFLHTGKNESSDSLTVEITYTGGREYEHGPGQSGNVVRIVIPRAKIFPMSADPPLKGSIKAKTAAEVILDLYGDDRMLVKVTDKMEVRNGRRHDFKVAINGRWYTSSWLLVKDPNATAVPAGPDHQDDIPGEQPESRFKGGGTQIRIDGDGDQHKELLLLVKAGKDSWAPGQPKSVTIEVTQIASGKMQAVELALPDPKGGSGALWPVVKQVTDGHQPTEIGLQLNATSLLIAPATRDATTVRYSLRGPSSSKDLVFAKEADGQGPQNVAAVDGTASIGGIHSADVKLGAYGDMFRVAFEPTQAILSVSARERGHGVVGGFGSKVTLSGAKALRVLQSDGRSVKLDLNGDGAAEVEIFDLLTQGGGKQSPEIERHHTITLVGPAIGGEHKVHFTVHGQTFLGPFGSASELDASASSNAQAVSGLQDQAGLGTYQQNMDAFEGAMFAARLQAQQQGLISEAMYKNWEATNGDLLVIRAQFAGAKTDPTRKVDPATQKAAVGHASAFFAALAEATKGKERVTSAQAGLGYSQVSTKNDYTGEEKFESWTLFVGTKRSTSENVGTLLAAGKYEQAFAAYNTVVGGLDKWIVAKLKAKNTRDGNDAAQRIEYLGAMRTELGKLEGVKPTRVQAVFHPDAGYKDALRTKEVPLALYYWKTGSQWKLKDLTNPNNTFEDEVAAKPGETEPPDSLFKELDYKGHFPKGIIHYQLPGGRGGQLKTTERMTLSEWLSYIGLGVAAIGLGLATFGTGTVAVVGAYALAASSVIGAAAAGAHMIEEADHGNLSAGEAAIDIAQIVAGLLGASQLVAGRLVMSAGAASQAGKAWKGTAALIAKWAQAGYVPLTIGRIAGDVVTVALGSKELARQLEDIEKSGAPEHEKSRLKALLLSQFAVSAGLVALSIKGDLPAIAKGKSLYFYIPKEGGPLVAAHMEKPGTIKFSQATVNAATSDDIPMDTLIKSMKADGWKGDPIDVVRANGELVSIDNRRLYAARAAGIEAPVTVHNAEAKLPDAMKDRFKLQVDLYEGAAKKLTTAKPDPSATPKYAKGAAAETWSEAVAFRTANQGKMTGIDFPIGGSHSLPALTTKPTTSKERKELGLPKTNDADDVVRLQTKGLVEGIENGTLDKTIFNTKSSDSSTTFGDWYKKWVESPNPVKLNADGPGMHKPSYPAGMPPEFESLINRMVADGDVVRNLKIKAQAAQIAKEIPDLNVDPHAPSYPETRKKLVEKYGEPMVKKYEASVLGTASPDRDAINKQVKQVIDDRGFDSLRRFLPDQELYLTGGATAPTKPLSEINSVKIVIVVPDGTTAKKIAELETRASSLVIATSDAFTKATGKGHLRVDAEVRTRSTAFSAMTVEGSGNFVRVDK